MRTYASEARQGKAKQLEEAPQHGTPRLGWLADRLADWLAWAEESKNATGAAAEVAQRGYVETAVRGRRCRTAWVLKRTDGRVIDSWVVGSRQ
jgi:hypothetical protein